ncbi:uncharacterized protein si:dkeyp-68b7.12 [Notolabrus celidotus]|uniref:uncharacterized protein si:dkeyp-68b7.12 n=1 Tax=Notolabrus celidotus TaxID=1203425 RepID=UPI00148FE203|nr:uncharacterized protein si:dkeyp-68b7.12 [Notolabrus celidotus]XP_034557954.1 uncharacterized protein si:dkeyp-68b7.12 [Notolabrus celidotus]XP_034557955.1 uncharacterized protein si:dkeyp-68b7.12 [Notolabrus celidotus]
MRRVRKKGGNKEKVFGCDLLDYLNTSSQEIPLVLRCCSEFVEKHGIVDGIYRLSGVSSNIQKLRGEFEGDGSPDLNKDLYLQDIHCVSSLCKAYFRELPNPLLTYQLYDKFAEAVAIQLEEERLVKIGDVLKELPTQHYRTLEFLMRHLVRMASYSSETNMHSRNLAIVWAPNLLRSKDIEVSGFNGTAAFMEVRVQSIVVEFILTHVPQLFPKLGLSNERRNSLPSPTAACIPGEGHFRFAAAQPIQNFGNISPGDGPLAIRPYHAIIEGTDKRKGSLKGRKWMSIFNIGGRFHDPRRRHKHSAKEKDRPALRPARSMDSLSTSPYPNEGSRRPAQRPPSTTSPIIPSTQQSGPDATAPTPAVGASEYAVTYRRGTGLVSGGSGTQGTYTALDPEGLGLTGAEGLQTRSPGLSTKVGRRAAMHITGPTMVTVPLHITSNLALGVLQGGGADRVIHRGRERDGGDRVEGREGGERKESIAAERKVEDGRKAEEEGSNRKRKVTDVESEGTTEKGVHEEEGGEGNKEEEKEVREEERKEPEMVTRNPSLSGEKRAKSVISNTEEDKDKDALDDEKDNDAYMDMKDMVVNIQPEVTQRDEVFDASDILNSTEVEADDFGLSGYVQDNFEFLDQMDSSFMDHMDCGAPYQVNEFSVEPPGHSDDEYEAMEQYQSSCHPTEDAHQHPGPETHTKSPTESRKHRPLSIDLNNRHTKSLSLPYMTSPVHGPEETSSEEEAESEDDYSEDDESMFVKSLPCDYFLNNLSGFESDADRTDRRTADGVAVRDTSEDKDCLSKHLELPACKISHDGQLEQVEVKDEEGNDGLEEKEITEKKEEVHQGGDQLETERKSKATVGDHMVLEDTQSVEEQPQSTEESTHWNDESSTRLDDIVEKKEAINDSHSDYPPFPDVSFVEPDESDDTPSEEFGDFSVSATEEHRSCLRGGSDEEDDTVSNVDVSQEIDVERKESEENMRIEKDMDDNEKIAEEEHEVKMKKDRKEEIDAIWDELESVVCEVIEDEESTQEKEAPEESPAERDDKNVREEQKENTQGEKKVEEGGKNGTEVDLVENTEENVMDHEEMQGGEGNTTELEEAIQEKCVISKETEQHDGERVGFDGKEEGHHGKKEADKQRIRIQSLDKKLKEAESNEKALKEGKGGVGRKLVVSQQPKFYRAKAVPVVPPKPQHCKVAAMTLRKQNKERSDADRERDNTLKNPTEGDKVCARWLEKDGDEEEEGEGKTEKPDRERDRWRDADESFMRDTNRNSPLSMNFEEAVAIATLKREKEKECDKEKQKD